MVSGCASHRRNNKEQGAHSPLETTNNRSHSRSHPDHRRRARERAKPFLLHQPTVGVTDDGVARLTDQRLQTQ